MKRIIGLITAILFCGAIPLSAQMIDPGTGKQINEKMYYPVWSPDGKCIAHCGGMWDGIWITSLADGSSKQLVGQTVIQYNGATYTFHTAKKCAYTPDGKEILYTSFLIDPARGTIATAWKPASGTSVYNEIPVVMAVNVETKATRVVREEAYYARYSRSGRYFAYVNYDPRACTADSLNARNHRAIAVYDSETKETRYCQLGVSIEGLDISPDEKTVAVSAWKPGGGCNLYLVPVDCSGSVDIGWKENPYRVNIFSSPEFSPDGRWIVYSAWVNEKRMLFVYDTRTGKTAPMFPESSVFNTDATWSPDGKKFCCTLVASTNKGGLYTFDFNEADIGVRPEIKEVPLYISPMYGKRLVDFDLASVSHDDSARYAAYSHLKSMDGEYSPIWSSDGKKIVFSCLSNPTMWTVPPEGGMPELIVDLTGAYAYKGYNLTLDHPQSIRYSPDYKEILFDTMIIDESRGTVVTITEGTIPGGGSHFGYSIKGAISVVKAMNVNTKESRIVMDNASNGVYSHNGRYFAYKTQGIDKHLALYDAQTGSTKALSVTSGIPLCFSPDDSYLLVKNGSIGCYKISPESGQSELLFSNTCKSADISSDGRFVLFSGLNNGKSGLHVFDLRTGAFYTLMTDGSGFTCRDGRFSPDGMKICYALGYSEQDSWTHAYVRDFVPIEIGIPTAVAEAVPSAFALTGNHPNPFNPSTTIGFSIDRPGAVRLAVYSLSGQKVRELVSGAVMRPGAHSIVWDGRDASGKAVSSGVYIARLVHDGRAVSRKMMLMK